MNGLHPIRLAASFHETIWGGRRLARKGWKQLPPDVAIGESWETENSSVVLNEPYKSKTLGNLVEELGPGLLGEQVIAIFGQRFPLLAKFLDANAQLSVQVHPDDRYAALYEGGKLGKTEFWYVLEADPGATIVHGFRARTSRAIIQRAIEEVRLEEFLHEEPVQAGDVIFVPAGTVHAIGGGIFLYELQEYSDITYRLYDYGRLTAADSPRELHIERSLDVASFVPSPFIKTRPVTLAEGSGYEDRCLVACPYFLVRELYFHGLDESTALHTGVRSVLDSVTGNSCVILSSLGAKVQVHYGEGLTHAEPLLVGETMVLPAALGKYRIVGTGRLLFSYVPSSGDEAWERWKEMNSQSWVLLTAPGKV